MSKINYNFRGIIFGMRPKLGIHSLTTALTTALPRQPQLSGSNISYKAKVDYQAFALSPLGHRVTFADRRDTFNGQHVYCLACNPYSACFNFPRINSIIAASSICCIIGQFFSNRLIEAKLNRME